MPEKLLNPNTSNIASSPNCVIRIPAKDSYSTSGDKIMGRQSANEGFLKAWFLYSGHKEFYCLTRFRSEAQIFADIGTGIYPNAQQQGYVFRWFAQMQIHHVKSVGTAFLPGPQVAQMSWIRRRNALCQENDFSLVGMTHTTCELPIQDYLADMLTAPVYSWDAQICPSESVRTMVARLLDDESKWLSERFSGTRVIQPQLPVLPLGVHCDQFELNSQERSEWRKFWRHSWNVGDNDICVLYMGRLDLQTKVNLFPMFDSLELAAQKLAKQSNVKLTLIIAGWFANDWNEKIIREGVIKACPSVRVVFEDGRASEVRKGIWHAADIFTSLVDNIQETFGLTPIEAMAAGLPVVVSDYDGYKESVRDGIDGYTVKTWQPAPGMGSELVDRHADVIDHYLQYAGRASWMVGVDIEQAASAYYQLAMDSTLRRTMGDSARQRAKEYDWSVLIPRYQELFSDLALIRAKDVKSLANSWMSPTACSWGQRHPRRSDPYHSFSNYPSDVIHEELLLKVGPSIIDLPKGLWREQLRLHFSRPVYEQSAGFLDENMMWGVIDLLSKQNNAISVGMITKILLNNVSSEIHDYHLQRQFGWLIKTGLVQPVSYLIKE